MFSKRLLFFSIVLIASTQAYAVSVEQTNSASSDTNSTSLRSLDEVKTSIESLRLKIKKIKDSIDTAISETKERHEDVIANDPEVLIAERKVDLAREVLEDLKKYPPAKGEWTTLEREKFNLDDSTVDLRIVINRKDKTLIATKYQADGPPLEVTFRYPFISSPVQQAMREVRKAKSELINPQVKELQELTVVQNSIGVLYQSLARIRKMLDVNSVNFEQVMQEIGNLDKKITDAELTAQSELLRISEKYQINNITKDKVDEPQMTQESQGEAQPAERSQGKSQASVEPKSQSESGPFGTSETKKKALLIVPSANFNDQELFETRRVLNQARIESVIASSKIGSLQGMHGGFTASEITLDKVQAGDFDAFVFIGGTGANEFFVDDVVLNIARKADAEHKVIAAISTSPTILANAGVLRGVRATGHISQREAIQKGGAQYTGAPVERDGLIITASAHSAVVPFAQTIVAVLEGKQLKPNEKTRQQ